MGEMHRLATSYSGNDHVAYPAWDSNDYLKKADRLLHPSQSRVVEAITSLKAEIARLDKSPSTLGLIHDDLHSGNVFRNEKGIVVLDFECLHKSWFVADISSALLFQVWIGPNKDKPESREKAARFLMENMKPVLEEQIPIWRRLGAI